MKMAVWCVAATIAVVPILALPQDVSYSYDAAGQLVAQTSPMSGLAITNIAPGYGHVGETCSIQGRGYSLTPSADVVKFNSVSASVSTAQADLLVAKVPSGATSGPISVTVSGVTVTSAQAFLVLPTSIPSSTVAGIGSAPADGNFHAVASLANQYVLVPFQGNAGDYFSLDLGDPVDLAGAALTYKVIGPDQSQLASGTINAAGPSAHFPALTTTGTYFIALSSTSDWLLKLAVSKDVVLAAGDSSFVVATSIANQTRRYVFAANAGDNLGLGITNLTASPGGGAVVATVKNASGTTVGTASCGYVTYTQCSGALRNLAVGNYTILVTPYDTRTSTFTGTFWLSHDVTGTITVGTPITIATTKPGQNATYTFAGTSAEAITVAMSNVTMSTGGRYLYTTVYNPSNTSIYSGAINTTTTTALTLAANGTYALFINPLDQGGTAITGSMQVAIAQTITASLPLDAASGTVGSTTVQGQQIKYTFSVTTAGDNLGLGITNLTASPGGGAVVATVKNASGTTVGTASCGYVTYTQCSGALRNLAVGNYTILVTPYDTRTSTFTGTFWLSHDVTGTITVGTPITIATTKPGQNATYTFAGTSAEAITVAMSNVTMSTGGRYLYTTVYNPSNTSIYSGAINTTTTTALTLAANGTYALFINPLDQGGTAITGSMQVTIAQTTTSSIPLDSTTGTVASTTLQGQRLQYTFAVTTAGDNLGLGITNLSTTPSGFLITATVTNSSGTTVGSASCGSVGYVSCSTALRKLPVGNYTMTVMPYDTRTQTFTATLWLSHDVTGTISMGTPITIATTKPGQNATYTFTGTASEAVTLALSNVTVSSGGSYISTNVNDPQNANLYSASIHSGTTTNKALTLTTAGTYTLYLHPADLGGNAVTASMQVTLTAN